MVGRGDATSSRIFHQCYLKCCKLQNLTPLNMVIPGGNGKVLDFCVDRIKYQDWAPILNALSCDLSLHSVSIRCRQQVKTILEHVDCERLARTVNKRAVILTNFMMSNMIEATSQMLSNTTLLSTLLIEGLPLKIPYLTPLCEALLSNNSLQHIYLPRCLIGDAGCLAVCKAVRCLPNILTLDMSGCDITPLGASYIADLIKYQKIHRYSENWVHTLRYRLPELDAMSGLRRITLCNNQQLGDAGVCKLLDVLSDDLWIKALDVQNCSVTTETSSAALQTLQSNTTLVILDLRFNPDVPSEWLSKVRAALRENERRNGAGQLQVSWLANVALSWDGRSIKSVASKNGVMSKVSNSRSSTNKYVNKTHIVKKEKDFIETLEEQLQEEISHRQQLEELNLQLVDQMKQLKQQQIRLWANGANVASSSEGSEQSVQASSRSGDLSSSSGSTSSVPIDQNTLSYIQQAFKDIYAFIKNNQCHGHCLHEAHSKEEEQPVEIRKVQETEEIEITEFRANIAPKKAQSSHIKLFDLKMNKTTKSAHMLGDSRDGYRDTLDMKPDMIERQMGDSKNAHGDDQISIVEDIIATQTKTNKKMNIFEHISPCSSVVSDSSETLVCSPERERGAHTPPPPPPPNPRDALYSSTSDDDSS